MRFPVGGRRSQLKAKEMATTNNCHLSWLSWVWTSLKWTGEVGGRGYNLTPLLGGGKVVGRGIWTPTPLFEGFPKQKVSFRQ